MKMLAVAAAALALSACATRERIVRVPVSTPCISRDQIPPDPDRNISSRFNGNAEHDISIIAANLIRWREHGEMLRGLLEECSGASPQAGSGSHPTG